jgi:hypothetical protein
MEQDIKMVTEAIDGLKSIVVKKDEFDSKLANVATKAELDSLTATVNKTDETVTKINEELGRIQTAKKKELKTFNEVWGEAIKSAEKDIALLSKAGGKFTIGIDLKTVGDMTNATNLTGDGVHTYNVRQGLVPNQRVNFRDLIPTVQLDTLSYVTYRETGGEGEFAKQTEGSGKAQVDYDFTEVKTVQSYIAGFARYSRQIGFNLPFFSTTLPRMLLRDFYKKENNILYTAAYNGATGSNTTTETDDVLQVIDYIYNQLAADFNASVVLVNPKSIGKMLKELFDNGNYLGSGSIVGTPNGSVTISGVPVIGASFVPDGQVFIPDTDFVERVEAESLNVTFSTEDGNNFTTNKITVKAECLEELNLLRTDAHIAATLYSV